MAATLRALSFWPLALAAVALGVPQVLARVPRDPVRIAAVLVPFYVLANAAAGQADPYLLVVFVATTWAALAAPAAAHAGREGLGPADVAVFLLLWVPFDLRFVYQLVPGPEGFQYQWWSVYLVVVAVLAFGRLRGFPGFDYRLVPRRRDLGAALVSLLAFGALAIPVGLAVGFLRYPPTLVPTLARAAWLAPEILVTVAIPEEVLFRAVLQAGLERTLGRPRAALAIASVLFGLTHWNNAAPGMQLPYVAIASVAGVFYGIAYRRGGSVLAPALCHACVDLAWALFLA